jgi:hypothetical protein
MIGPAMLTKPSRIKSFIVVGELLFLEYQVTANSSIFASEDTVSFFVSFSVSFVFVPSSLCPPLCLPG